MQEQVQKAVQMKAIVYYDYGSSDVLKSEKIEEPTARDSEVLIKVRTASVNPLDWRYMRGPPFIVRIQTGLRKPKLNRRANEMAPAGADLLIAAPMCTVTLQ